MGFISLLLLMAVVGTAYFWIRTGKNPFKELPARFRSIFRDL